MVTLELMQAANRQRDNKAECIRKSDGQLLYEAVQRYSASPGLPDWEQAGLHKKVKYVLAANRFLKAIEQGQ